MVPGEYEIGIHEVVQPVGTGRVSAVGAAGGALGQDGERMDEQVSGEIGAFLSGEHLVEGLFGAPVQQSLVQCFSFGMFVGMHEAGGQAQCLGTQAFDVDADRVGRMPAQGRVALRMRDADVPTAVLQIRSAVGRVGHFLFPAPASVHEHADGQPFHPPFGSRMQTGQLVAVATACGQQGLELIFLFCNSPDGPSPCFGGIVGKV